MFIYQTAQATGIQRHRCTISQQRRKNPKASGRYCYISCGNIMINIYIILCVVVIITLLGANLLVDVTIDKCYREINLTGSARCDYFCAKNNFTYHHDFGVLCYCTDGKELHIVEWD